MGLIEDLIQEKWLRTPRIIQAFKAVKRADFLPADIKNLAELNEALPIGYSQTISQPLVVAFMLELLQPRTGEKILDIGAGSGWTSALLAHIVSGGKTNEKLKMKNERPQGKIIALELVPELKEFGEKNVARYNYIDRGRVQFVCADGSRGYKKEAPYDKILCSAAAQKQAPPAWKRQLKIGGRIVTPIGASIWLLIKKSESEFEETEYPGFAFVPLIEK